MSDAHEVIRAQVLPSWFQILRFAAHESGRLCRRAADIALCDQPERDRSAPQSLIEATDCDLVSVLVKPEIGLAEASDQPSRRCLGILLLHHAVDECKLCFSAKDRSGIRRLRTEMSGDRHEEATCQDGSNASGALQML
jgi:hypothetical protein